MANNPRPNCGDSISPQTASCPHCGTSQQPPAPCVVPTEAGEKTLYADSTIVVTTARIIVGPTTYAVRNVKSVGMTSTRPRVGCASLLWLAGLVILLSALTAVPASFGFALLGALVVAAGILRWINAKTTYHVELSSGVFDGHTLSSTDKADMQRLMRSINEAMKCR